MVVTLEKGSGYWDITSYPYKGDFKRLTEDTEAELIPGLIYKGGEMRVKLHTNQHIICINYSAIVADNFEAKSFIYDTIKAIWKLN